MALDLFETYKTNREVSIENAKAIAGLAIFFDFINDEEESQLIFQVDKHEWLSDLKRRVQHYGFKYDYKSRRLDESFYIGPIPYWLLVLIERLNERGIIDFKPDQAIVNEYVDAQGIAPHIDCEPCFGDTIISISLGGACVFNFERAPNSKDRIPIFLEPKTLVVMKGESRFDWYHGIQNRKSDVFNGMHHKRGRRISITFRKVKM
jgi:alkylated DNA repair dioxygenase AlkB